VILYNESEILKITAYLVEKGIVEKDENPLSLSRISGGNMNVVMRFQTDKKSVIVKQSRPYVEKYPSVSAPLHRSHIEADYYSFTNPFESIRPFHTQVLHYDAEQYLLILSDLGDGQDCSYLYRQDGALSDEQIKTLVSYLQHLHRIPIDGLGIDANMDMRLLNAEHIFDYPFRNDTGMNLDTIVPGLEALARKYRSDTALVTKVNLLKSNYISAQPISLLHGDYYPGSWFIADGDIKIIDPEFAFCGFAEYDLGVMRAHLIMSNHDEKQVDSILRYYDPSNTFSVTMCDQFAGVEIMRRLIGLAQLPIHASLEQRKIWMEQAREMMNA
jgi:5-methylthioribose kinase